MKKTATLLASFYNELRLYFDPSIEGSPYDRKGDYKTKQDLGQLFVRKHHRVLWH